MNWKNSKTDEVISDEDYNRLSYDARNKFYPVTSPATHRLSDDDDGTGNFLMGIVVAEMLFNDTDYSSNADYSSNDNSGDSFSNDTDFGGGDFGGGGAGGDF